MRKLGATLVLIAVIGLIPLTALAGGSYDCEHKPWKCDTTTSTTQPEETTTTLTTTTTEPATTSSSSESSTTSSLVTTTTVGSTTTTGFETTTTLLPSFEPSWFCEVGATWLAVDYEVSSFARIDVHLETVIGSPDSTFLSPGEIKWGVLNSDTFFTFVGLLYDESTVEIVLNVPATDCDEGVVSSTTSPDPDDPTVSTLPFTGASSGMGQAVISAAGLLGLGALLLWSTRREDEDSSAEPFIKIPK